MSTATSCTSCGTVFRVVQDQLKVSEGWVRCGRCRVVFNAVEGLFDLDPETAPGSLPGRLQPLTGKERVHVPNPPGAARGTSGMQGLDSGTERHDPALVNRLGSELFPERQGTTGGRASSRFTAIKSTAFKAARHDSDLMRDNGARPRDSGMGLADSAQPRYESSETPEFLRHGERATRGHRQWVGGVFSSVALGLLVALALQIAHHWRDEIAASWRATRPLLVQWCQLASCTIEVPRRIEDIAVESTGFARIAGADQFRLSLVLRTRSALALAMPWVELSLTDASGSLLVRKALSPMEFRISDPVLEPASETPMQLLLAAGTPLVTGYTVEVFYP